MTRGVTARGVINDQGTYIQGSYVHESHDQGFYIHGSAKRGLTSGVLTYRGVTSRDLTTRDPTSKGPTSRGPTWKSRSTTGLTYRSFTVGGKSSSRLDFLRSLRFSFPVTVLGPSASKGRSSSRSLVRCSWK